MTRFKMPMIIAILIVLMTTFAYAEDIVIATGSKDGYYNNGLYNLFSKAIKRASDGDIECARFNEKGTDGTIHNIKLVAKGGENDGADVAFVQLGGMVLDPQDNIEVIGTIMYEVAHLVVPKKGKVGDVDDLESKKGYSVGMNTRSGAAVTWNVFGKVDKDFKNANPVDYQSGSRAIAAMVQGNVDSYFFVSAPRTKAIKRVLNSDDVRFAHVWDSDFNDFQFRGKDLYKKIKVGKKEGYDKTFTSIAVPCVVIANTTSLEENEDLFDALFDATTATFTTVKANKKFNYYPR